MKKRKTYEVSVINKTYSKIYSDQTKFYTSDTALELNFKIKEVEYNFDSAEIILLNIDDRSLVTRPVVKSTEGFTYELEADIVAHYGEWRGQLKLNEGGEIYVSSPVGFRIENDLTNDRPPQLTDIRDWETLAQNAKDLIAEMGDIVTNESARIEAEKQREETVANIETRQTIVENQFNDINQELTTKDIISAPEIIAARGGEPTLNDRLDKEQQEVTAQLAQKAPYSHVWGMGNLGQDVKEALTGGSVAVVGRNTVGKENIKKESVTIGKTSFTRRGLNYFDGEYVEGVALDYGTAPMSLVSGLPGRMTAIIPVEGGKTYHYEGYDETGRLAIAATKEYPNFSENKGESFVDYDLVNYISTAKVYRELEVPVDANFLVINVSGDYSEPELQVSEIPGIRTNYDRRMVPSVGGVQSAVHLGHRARVNFDYGKEVIEFTGYSVHAFGVYVEINDTVEMIQVPELKSFIIVTYEIESNKIFQHYVPGGNNPYKRFIPDNELILGSYSKKGVRPAEINGFKNYAINGLPVLDGRYAMNESEIKGNQLLWELGSIYTDGSNYNGISNRIRTTDFFSVEQGKITLANPNFKFLITLYDLNRQFKSSTLWMQDTTFKITEPSLMKIVLAKVDDGEIQESEIPTLVEEIDIYYLGTQKENNRSYSLKIGGVGRVNGGITSNLATEPVLASVKNAKYLSDGTLTEPLATGFLYHGSGTDRNLYYSQNQADKLDKVGTLDFNPERYNAGIGEEGEIIWVNENGRSVSPRVHKAGQYDSSIELTGMAKTPIAWLQNCGIDFARDANGEEYCIFGEYTGANVGEIRLWKVTKPYSDPTNWRIVKTFNQSQSYKQGTENEVWHIHTVQHDPYTRIWYATSGDSDLETKWWYSTDEGESWTELLNGTYWESQIARLLNFVFTEDYIYWGNDYGTNHSLNRVARGASGVIDPTTREKLAELNKNQSTYATVLTNSPKGILLLDRVDTDFSVRTNKLDVEFYSFDDKKIHVLDTLERLDNKSSYFGFRCKSYTLYQPIYDDRIVVGFGSSPNWIKLPYNTNENRNTLTLSIS